MPQTVRVLNRLTAQYLSQIETDVHKRLSNQISWIIQAAGVAPIDTDRFDSLVKGLAAICLLLQGVENPHGICRISCQLENHQNFTESIKRLTYVVAYTDNGFINR